MTIKEYYTETFPDDDLGKDINDKATFIGLFHTLDNYGNVYHYIGVGDSLIRERIFEQLCNIMDCEYEYVYNQWLLTNN
jgi:hypothetical protein